MPIPLPTKTVALEVGSNTLARDVQSYEAAHYELHGCVKGMLILKE
jgi:hypothetical protein